MIIVAEQPAGNQRNPGRANYRQTECCAVFWRRQLAIQDSTLEQFGGIRDDSRVKDAVFGLA